MNRTSIVSLVLVLVGACKFPELPDVGAGGDTDAGIDAGPVCTPNMAVCAAGKLTQCDANGYYVAYTVPNGGPNGASTTLTMHDYECPMDCDDTEPRCADINAANGLNAALDQVSPGLMDLDLPAAASPILIDTDTVDPQLGEATIVHPQLGNIRVPVQVIDQIDAPQIFALKVRTFTLREGATIRATGRRVLAIASQFDVYIAGRIDLAAGGPGQMAAGVHSLTSQNDPMTSGGGGNAGCGSSASNGQSGPCRTGPSQVTPITGGQPGIWLLYPLNNVYIPGGEAGGGFQAVSRTKIACAATALIDVSGGGGGAFQGGGTFALGGGAAGSVLMEAPHIALAPGAIIVGRGGGGGAFYSQQDARAGQPGSKDGPGAGGSAAFATGGTGGSESANPTNGTVTGNASAGGAGAAGHSVFRTRTGTASVPAGSMRIYNRLLQLTSR